MYASTLAFAFALPPPSADNSRRTLLVTLLYASGAIIGWPFALALAIPFVFEELFILGADRVAPSDRGSWILGRWKRLFAAGITASLIFVRNSHVKANQVLIFMLDTRDRHRHPHI
jgi:alpha-1,2-mannosyltransferase